METKINTSLCLCILQLAHHACSAAVLTFFRREQSGKKNEGGKYSFLNHHRLNMQDMFPPEGTLMIPSPNGICLRSIRTPHYDDVSTGIMSDWISSVPVGWAGDKLVTWDRWNRITGMTSCVIKCEMKPGTNVVYWCLLFSFQRRRDIDATKHVRVAGETYWAIFCLINLHFGFNRRLSVPLCQPFVFFLYGVLLWNELTASVSPLLSSSQSVNVACHLFNWFWIYKPHGYCVPFGKQK